MPTQKMEEFDIIHFNQKTLIDIVKKLCMQRKFKVVVVKEKEREDGSCAKMKFKCSLTPYYANETKSVA